MSEATDRFLLPFIIPGQAQKELFHNEALVRLDAALHPAVEEGPLATPPADPEPGDCWLVAADPDGPWDGKAHCLALWSEAGWRFVVPLAGMSVWNKQAGHPLRWDGVAWVSALAAGSVEIGGVQVLGARQAAIANPVGGGVVDAEARTAIAALIAALMSHGLID